MSNTYHSLLAAFIVTAGIVSPGPVFSRETLVLTPPTPEELKLSVDAWLLQRNLQDSPVVEAVQPLWQLSPAPTTEELFNALMQTFYIADEQARQLVEACRSFEQIPASMEVPFSANHDHEPLFSSNLNFFYGRYLSTLTLYEEALAIFQRVDEYQVVDPAGYLFHRAVCEHHLLLKDQGLQTLSRLLKETESVPVRYRKLAELMEDDLEKVEPKSIEEVARQMRDVERRLALGRAGERVQDVEQRIIDTLDEIIKKLEDQQSSSSSSGSGMAGGPATNPADDSYLGGVRGDGLTDKKEQGHLDNWGDLPPKAQSAAKNLLDRQFPPHYRQAVEQYLQKLADRPAPSQ